MKAAPVWLHNGPTQAEARFARMPTLFRFTVTIAVLVAIAYGVMFALAMLVEPRTREIVVPVPIDGVGSRPETSP